MKLSELLEAHVDDVLLVQDGPYIDGFGAALRVAGLLVGHGSIGVRLGYHRGGITGPWLLRKVFGAIERKSRYVPWETVTDWDDDQVTIAARAEELGPPT